MQELLVLLFEDPGAERVIHVDGADDAALDHQGHGDDRAQVVQDDRLLAFETVVQEGVGRHHRLACADHLFDHGAGPEELLLLLLGLLAAGHPDLHLVAVGVDQDDEAAGRVHELDHPVHDPHQDLVQVKCGSQLGGHLVKDAVTVGLVVEGHGQAHYNVCTRRLLPARRGW